MCTPIVWCIHRHAVRWDGMGCAGNSVYFNGGIHTLSYQRIPSHPSAPRVCECTIIHDSMDPPNRPTYHLKRQLDWFSRFCTAEAAHSPYTIHWAAHHFLPPQNLPISVGVWTLRPTRPTIVVPQIHNKLSRWSLIEPPCKPRDNEVYCTVIIKY